MPDQDDLDKLMIASIHEPQSVIVAQAKPQCGEADYNGCAGNAEISCCDSDGSDPLTMPCTMTMTWYHVPSGPPVPSCTSNGGSAQMCWVGATQAAALSYPTASGSHGGWYGIGSWSNYGFGVWVMCDTGSWKMYLKWTDLNGSNQPLCDILAPSGSGYNPSTGWQCFTTCNNSFPSCNAQADCPPDLPFRLTCATTIINCTPSCWYMRIDVRP